MPLNQTLIQSLESGKDLSLAGGQIQLKLEIDSINHPEGAKNTNPMAIAMRTATKGSRPRPTIKNHGRALVIRIKLQVRDKRSN